MELQMRLVCANPEPTGIENNEDFSWVISSEIYTMDHLHMEAYVQATCSILDFDFGEIWTAKKEHGNFMQTFEIASWVSLNRTNSS